MPTVMGRIVHCPGNMCPGDICPDREYLSCYWPNFDQTLGALIFLDQNFLWIKIWFDHFCFGPKYFLDWRQNVLVPTLFGPKLFRTPNYFGTKFFWPEFFIPNFFGHKTFWAMLSIIFTVKSFLRSFTVKLYSIFLQWRLGWMDHSTQSASVFPELV